MNPIHAMEGSSRGALLASIHDVGPRFEREVDLLADRLGRHVGRRFAMLVVPDHWGEAPIAQDRGFQRRLRAWADEGIEMFAHGWYHRADQTPATGLDRWRGKHMTAGEGEFLGLDRATATARMKASCDLIADVTGRAPAGFIAPAWLYGEGARAALDELGVPLAEDHFRVWSPRTGAVLARGPVVTWASRSPRRTASSLVFARIARTFLKPQRVLRVAVHPGDAHVPSILESVDRLFSSARSRRPANYAALAGHGA